MITSKLRTINKKYNSRITGTMQQLGRFNCLHTVTENPLDFLLRIIFLVRFHHLMQYLYRCLWDSAISANDFYKLIFQPTQISVSLYNISPQAGEVCYQQDINFAGSYCTGHLGQPPAGKVKPTGLFGGNTHNLKTMLPSIGL